MNRFIITANILLAAIYTSAAPVTFSGSTRSVITDTPAASTGLDAVYILDGTDGVNVTYTASSASAPVTWAKFSNAGAAYAVEIPASDISRNGVSVTLTAVDGDTGYAITETGKTTYFWIVDYSKHTYNVDALIIDPEQDCDRAFLSIEGSAGRILYYSINGRAYDVDRDITLSYTTLKPIEEAMRYECATVDEHLPYISGTINVTAPLCDTYFHISGDRMLRQWGLEREISSSYYTTQSVSAEVSVEQIKRTGDNEIKSDETLGGSAPAETAFSAVVSDAAIFTEWQFATDTDFEDITFRTNDLEFTHTFRDMGTNYIRFVAANADGNCQYFSETFTVYIGESRLLCPNAFSPGASEGVNDEWKVSYKSIISFECYIFNRWGQKMAEFHDPSKGWDGKHGGKLVPAGVYYYVIKAKGSDGKNYNLSGDINILRSSR